jgi:3-oxoacyl-(acyl-carrier-protein) synthase
MHPIAQRNMVMRILCFASGVCIGTGMSGVAQVADAGRLVLEGRGRRVTPYFVPSILNNMAAGVSLSSTLHRSLS